MIRATVSMAAGLLLVALVFGVLGQVVKAAESLLPACDYTSDGSQAPMCSTPGNTPNR